MARPLRLEYPGAVYHLTARGNARQAIYRDDEDRRIFLELLGAAVERYQWRCHAYCLLPNQYHLLVETPQGHLSAGMRQLNGVYTQRFNRRHGRVVARWLSSAVSARRAHADDEATREEQRVSPDHRRALHTVLAVSADACMLQTREARRITNRFARPAHSERDVSRYFLW